MKHQMFWARKGLVCVVSLATLISCGSVGEATVTLLTPTKTAPPTTLAPTDGTFGTATRQIPSTPITTVASPKYVSRCPSPQETTPEALQIPSGQRILLTEVSTSAPSVLKVNSYSDAGLTEFLTLATTSRLLGVSPDGEWISEVRYDPSFEQGALWLVNMAGDEREIPVSGFVKSAIDVRWIDHQHLVKWELVPQPMHGTNSLPTLVLNPFTGDLQPMAPLPEVPQDNQLWIGPRADQIVYVQPGTGDWVLYDYRTRKSYNLLNARGNYQLAWSASGSRLALLSVPTASDTGMLVTWFDTSDLRVARPVEILPAGLIDKPVWSDDARYLALQTYVRGQAGQADTTDIYVFDTDANTIMSFCNPPKATSQLFWSNSGLFLAWEHGENTTLVLDVNTGHYANISDGQIIGWGTAAAAQSP